MADPFVPILTGDNTDAKISEQGYTYNQAGMTYNQAGATYGGAYNIIGDVLPSVSLAQTIKPFMSLAENINPQVYIKNTQAKLADQGYTYNQAGFTYNQVGVTYGGAYNLEGDIVAAISFAETVIPVLIGIDLGVGISAHTIIRLLENGITRLLEDGLDRFLE